MDSTQDQKAIEVARQSRARKLDAYTLSIAPMIQEAVNSGAKSNAAIVSFLTARGVRTRTGEAIWSDKVIKTVRLRLASLGAT